MKPSMESSCTIFKVDPSCWTTLYHLSYAPTSRMRKNYNGTAVLSAIAKFDFQATGAVILGFQTMLHVKWQFFDAKSYLNLGDLRFWIWPMTWPLQRFEIKVVDYNHLIPSQELRFLSWTNSIHGIFNSFVWGIFELDNISFSSKWTIPWFQPPGFNQLHRPKMTNFAKRSAFSYQTFILKLAKSGSKISDLLKNCKHKWSKWIDFRIKWWKCCET